MYRDDIDSDEVELTIEDINEMMETSQEEEIDLDELSDFLWDQKMNQIEQDERRSEEMTILSSMNSKDKYIKRL